ncbi:hypothetical protein COLO4_30332 [Corchorus olitorius]|uniref:RNase H type-1 domain-containing protein n=1 Tax=Corchorus olitorius TaxID=93759 RepID=A0A1R3H917_9ROSI|nr:hypothetical protein COLO4_30332 [Corchorus olitorius]
MRCQVINGQSVNIWKDRWIPAKNAIQLQNEPDRDDLPKKVAEIMDKEEGIWRLDTIRSELEPDTISNIEKLPICQSSAADRVVWPYNKNGSYSVKSGYLTIKNTNPLAFGGASSSHQCVWFGSGLGYHVNRDSITTFDKWLVEVLTMKGIKDKARVDLYSRVSFICWQLWKARCTACFEKKGINVEKITFVAERAVLEFKDAKEYKFAMHKSQRKRDSIVTWQPPEFGFLKLNYDGAFDEATGQVAIGVIIRDENGAIKDGVSKLVTVTSSAEAEALAVKEVVLIVKDQSLTRATIETDSELVQKSIQGYPTNQVSDWRILPIVQDIKASLSLLQSPLQSPSKLLEQAKEIVDNSSELVNLDTTSSVAEVMENPRERRPALGRKRARFSLKPNSSQPTVSLEPSLDIDKLKDPEEFFMAYERAENAKREIQKQTGGVLMDLDQNSQSLAARPRRPGMLRKSVKYRHHYSTAMSPLENLEEENASTLCDSQQEKHDRDVELEEKELAGLATNAENKVNELLDELLTSDFDGDETVSLLQEHLQIKPIDMEKICLPDLQDIRKIDLKASRKNLAKPRNSSTDIPENSVHYVASPTPPKGPLASISLLKKRMSLSDLPSDPFSTDDFDRSLVRDASPVKDINKQSDLVDTEREVRLSPNDNRRTQKQDESSAHPLASPTPPRNPFASMSLQKKQLLQSDPPSAPFSVDNIDRSPGRNASPTESINKQYSQGGIENGLNMSHLLKSPMLEANQTETANAGSELDGRDFAGLFDKFVNDNARRFDSGIDMISSESQADLERSSLNKPETDADSHSINPNECDGRVEDILVVSGVSAQTQLNEEGPTVNDPHTIQRKSGMIIFSAVHEIFLWDGNAND